MKRNIKNLHTKSLNKVSSFLEDVFAFQTVQNTEYYLNKTQKTKQDSHGEKAIFRHGNRP